MVVVVVNVEGGVAELSERGFIGAVHAKQRPFFLCWQPPTCLHSSMASESSPLASSLHMSSYAVTVTNSPAIKNAPLIGLAEGNGYFNNYHLVALVLAVPWFVKRILPLFNLGGWKTYWFLVLLLGIPITIAYWSVVSHYGPRKNQKIQLPGRSIEEYFTIHDPDLKTKYNGKQKIPMQIFHDAFFEGKIDFNGDRCPGFQQRS